MSRETWPESIRRACLDTWKDDDDAPERDPVVEAFAQCWDGFEAAAWMRAVQTGEGTERRFAIFALGYLGSAQEVELLVPLLHSLIRQERWASAIALGRRKDQRAFPFLLTALLEGIVYHPFYDEATQRTLWNAVSDACERASERALWEQEMDPLLLEMWNKESAYEEEEHWYLRHRYTVIDLLGSWGDPGAIPALTEAFRVLCAQEQREDAKRISSLFQSYFDLEDTIAYTLGQLGGWYALDDLDLLPGRLPIARFFLAVGSLGLPMPPPIPFAMLESKERREAILQVIQERFLLSPDACRIYFFLFRRLYFERYGSWDDQGWWYRHREDDLFCEL